MRILEYDVLLHAEKQLQFIKKLKANSNKKGLITLHGCFKGDVGEKTGLQMKEEFIFSYFFFLLE